MGFLHFGNKLVLNCSEWSKCLGKKGEEGARMKWAKEELRDAFHALVQHYLEPI